MTREILFQRRLIQIHCSSEYIVHVKKNEDLFKISGLFLTTVLTFL